MPILFIEDEAEAKIANFVRAGLKEQGFVVDYCDNGNLMVMPARSKTNMT